MQIKQQQMNNTARICRFIAQGSGVGLVTFIFTHTHCKKHSELSSRTHTYTHTRTHTHVHTQWDSRVKTGKKEYYTLQVQSKNKSYSWVLSNGDLRKLTSALTHSTQAKRLFQRAASKLKTVTVPYRNATDVKKKKKKKCKRAMHKLTRRYNN